MDMRGQIAVCSFLVALIGQSVEATNYDVCNSACADAGGNQSIDEAAPRSAHQSENRLARGGPLHLFRSSAGAVQPAQRRQKVLGHTRN
jgi:hypothetical protein